MPNPFLSGSPVRGERFGDRETEVAWLVRRLLDGQNALIISPRRYGKSSLLIRAAEVARASGARAGMANLMRCASRRQVAQELLHAVAVGALGWRLGTVEQVRDRLAHLPGVRPQLEPDGWTYSLELTHSDSDFAEEIRRPVGLLARSAPSGHPVALILDEFQQVADIDDTLGSTFKAITDDLPEVSLVFCGSRRHLMERLFVGVAAPLQNVGDLLALPVIDQDAMVDFLVRRCTSDGRTMTETAARLVWSTVRGVPHFVQLLAAAAWDRGDPVIDVPQVQRALVDVLVTQRGALADRFEGFTTTQKKLVQALAGHPTREPDSKSFLDRADLAKSSAQRARLQLEDREQIMDDERVGWRLQDPIFERYLEVGRPLDLGKPLDPDTVAPA